MSSFDIECCAIDAYQLLDYTFPGLQPWHIRHQIIKLVAVSIEPIISTIISFDIISSKKVVIISIDPPFQLKLHQLLHRKKGRLSEQVVIVLEVQLFLQIIIIKY